MDVRTRSPLPSSTTAPRPRAESGGATAPEVAAAAGGWLALLHKTLKNARLYGGGNPTVDRFRADLATGLLRLLDAHGPISLRFAADDVLLGDQSLFPARARDDNLAHAFHRDGIRRLTFSPGLEPRELDHFVDAVLRATTAGDAHDDLVTLLWEANLPHIASDYVPASGDVGDAGAEGDGELVPWPTASAATVEDRPAPAADAPVNRSDDWTTGIATIEVEAAFDELETLAPVELERFRDEFTAEHEFTPLTTMLAVGRAFLDSDTTDEDRREMAALLTRLLRACVAEAAWIEAREAVELLRDCGTHDSIETFAQELLQPVSISAIAGRLDAQDSETVADCVGLATDLGPPAVEFLLLLIGESRQFRVRRLLGRAVAAECQGNPERLAPWLADARWFVVRNVVQILGWIGGDTVPNLLAVPARHADARVRREVVAALRGARPELARAVLLPMLEGADSRQLCSVVHELARDRGLETVNVLLGYFQAPGFLQRPPAERRSILRALGRAGGDDAVPHLEAELHRGGWFEAGVDAHRRSVAQCLARIGSAAAVAALEHGAHSRRPSVRRACELALGRRHD